MLNKKTTSPVDKNIKNRKWLNVWQDCALTVLGGPMGGAMGDQQILAIFTEKSYTAHPGFHRFRALGSLQIFLEHNLVYFFFCQVCY